MVNWKYDSWESGAPYDWSPAERGDSPWDDLDFHVDLGCGRLKKGRIGVDLKPDPGVNVVCDFDAVYRPPKQVMTEAMMSARERDQVPVPLARGPLTYLVPFEPNGLAEVGPGLLTGGPVAGLPFGTDSIESIVSHHALEHVGEGFIPLIDEVYRVLKPGGIFRAITPLFPSRTAVEDPDHKRYFTTNTWKTFEGSPDVPHWHEAFSTPYTRARFEILDADHTPVPEGTTEWSEEHGARELRVAMRARK